MNTFKYIALIALLIAVASPASNNDALRLLQEERDIGESMADCVTCVKNGNHICQNPEDDSDNNDVYDCCSSDSGDCSQHQWSLPKYKDKSSINFCDKPEACGDLPHNALVSTDSAELSFTELSDGEAWYYQFILSDEEDIVDVKIEVSEITN